MLKEFTTKGYAHLLEVALNNRYTFIDFEEKAISSNNKFCLMRHDIDADLKAAVVMSEIEKEYKVRATYFIMMRSPVYNLFTRQNHRYVEELIKNGHALALHYDEGFYPLDGRNLQELIEMEAIVIEKMFGQKIKAVSFHQPGPKVISNEIRIENYINTYDKQHLAGIHYISDSNKLWKAHDGWEIFEKSNYDKIHLLIHPMWWVTEKEYSTQELWDKAIADNVQRNMVQIKETERAFGSVGSITINKH